MSWWWRTKPRSIIKTVLWFKEFGKLEGQNWNEEDPSRVSVFNNQKIHPVRREYIYNAHGDEDALIKNLTISTYLSGKKDSRETESNGRNDKITFEFFGFGYIDKNGIIKITKVGRRIINNSFDSEDYLKQLLKLEFPNVVSRSSDFHEGEYVFPFELFCRAIDKFGYLNRSEIVLLFGCKSQSGYEEAFKGIQKFRDKYEKLPNKNRTSDVKALTQQVFIDTHGSIPNQINSYYDYAEAFCRCLVYTGMFKTSGRSLATKLRVPEYEKTNFSLILNNYSFCHRSFSDMDSYMEYYGDTENVALPWDNVAARKILLEEKKNHLEALKTDLNFATNFKGEKDVSVVLQDAIDYANDLIGKSDVSLSELKDAEKAIVGLITTAREHEFINSISKTDNARKEILEKYDEIINDNEDLAALWLEVNTWKSLIAIKGEKVVKRNFEIEEDLTPKSFAPGIGNTPDMEMYLDDCIIIPEVSLMTGVRQWEHEASSVIDHVLSFIKDYNNFKVRGLFLSSSINIRTRWQFFVLNKASWVEMPVPVIPLTIEQYKNIIEVFYSKDLDVKEFVSLLERIHKLAIKSKNYENWFIDTNNLINNWTESQTE